MKPYNRFLLWVHSFTIGTNILAALMNIASGKYFVAGCQIVTAFAFFMIAKENIFHFIEYRKNLKIEKEKAKELEKAKLLKAIAREDKKRRKAEIKEKMNFF